MAKGRIRLTWASILALSGLAAAIGFAIVNNSTSRTGALVDAFAAGALLTMIADEMAPEATSETVSTLASQPLPGSLSPSSSPVSNSPARHATTHSELDADDDGQLPRTDHALCAITHASESAIDRHFMSGSDGHGLGSSRALAVPQLGSQCRGWLPEWLPNVIRFIGGHATKPPPYKASLARPEELDSPTF